MKQNKIFQFEKLYFVPYSVIHVQQYHLWMSDQELLNATASEPLTLEEEYENQISWARDKDKYTFILEVESDHPNGIKGLMIGDVNLFVHQDSAEIEIMIAEREYHRMGYGWKGVKGMIYYGINNLNIAHFTCKIGYKNTASQRLFHKLGFVEVSRSEYFQELELHYQITDTERNHYKSLQIQDEEFTEN
jgi:RimJ/RimL family protein N-acetyltransferase